MKRGPRSCLDGAASVQGRCQSTSLLRRSAPVVELDPKSLDLLPTTGGSPQDQCGRCGAGGVRCRVPIRPGGHQQVNKIALTAVGTVAAALMLVGCGSGPSARPTSMPTPSTSQPSWASSYTPQQVGDYNAAMAAFSAIEAREAPVWANPGRFSRAEVESIFRHDWSNTARPLRQFETYLSNGVRVSGAPVVISSRPLSITPNSGGSGLEQITIRQCVDGSRVHASQHGSALPTAGEKRGVREVEMFKTPAGKYLLFQVGKGAGSC